MTTFDNPYIAGNPVTKSEMFFGREDVFTFVQQSLIGKHRDNVLVLYGQRRTGKTSALHQMPLHLNPRYLCIFVDLHSLALEGLDGFLWELANHIIRGLRRSYQIDLSPLNKVEFMNDPRNYFESEFLSHIWSTIGDRHILLMLDEAARLQEQVDAGKLEKESFEYIRHLMQYHEQLNFLFSLSSGLEEMEKEYAFLFNVALYKKISFLTRATAIALITQPVKHLYQLEAETIERILQTTSGHPYFTQLVCHSLFNRWLQLQPSSLESQNVDAILSEVIERGLAVLKHVWDESTIGERAIMASVATGVGKPDRSVRTNEISMRWKNHGIFLPKGEITEAIDSLVTREVLVGQDSYAFAVELQRLWVQKYRRMESV